MKKTVLGIKIDDIDLKEAVENVENSLKSRKAGYLVVTPNPEFLISARSDKEFASILNSADLSIPDGSGLQYFGGIKNRVPGVDLMLKLCEEAAKNNWTVGLFGGEAGVAKECSGKLQSLYPGLKISFAIDGQQADAYLLSHNSLPTTDLLFVALGHVKQEKFLSFLKAKSYKLPAYRVGMGVGGSFDLISGRLPRAPKIFQVLGLEWLWRGFTKPGHWSRVWRATVVFPWLCLQVK